jgi:4-amino-4-deoxy-L-arabinose transferase-like glycosyltransferase
MISKVFVKKKTSWFIFIGIIIAAFILRFWQLGSIPEGFHSDEAAYGYNAYSLLKTGKDEYGKLFPLILKSFGDYKGAIYAYLIIPFIYLFGLNEWAVRAPSAVFGVLFVILTYSIANRLSKNRSVAIVSMLLAALSPVGIFLSRVQSDPLVCVYFFYLGFYCWLLWESIRKIPYIFLSILCILISFYVYPSTRLFAIPFLLFIGIRFWPVWNKRVRLVAIVSFVSMSLVVVGMLLSTAGTRFEQISVFSKEGVQLSLEEKIREDGAMGGTLLVTRVFHNKVIAYGQFFVDNFASYISYDFLFRRASQPLREQVPDMGVLLLVELPFLLIGIFAAFRKRLSWAKTSLMWFLLVPAILSVVSEESPNIHRFFLAVIPIHLLVALGIQVFYKSIRTQYRVLAVVLLSLVFIVNEGYFLHQLFIHQPMHNPIFRNNSEKEVAASLKELYPTYDVIVSQKMLEQMLFYWPVDPATYQKDGSPRDFENARYKKFLFVSDACPSYLNNVTVKAISGQRTLYVDLGQCQVTKNTKVIKTIPYRNTLTAFRLVELYNKEIQ